MPPQLGGILFDLRKFGFSIQAGERNARQFLCSNLFLKNLFNRHPKSCIFVTVNRRTFSVPPA